MNFRPSKLNKIIPGACQKRPLPCLDLVRSQRPKLNRMRAVKPVLIASGFVIEFLVSSIDLKDV